MKSLQSNLPNSKYEADQPKQPSAIQLKHDISKNGISGAYASDRSTIIKNQSLIIQLEKKQPFLNIKSQDKDLSQNNSEVYRSPTPNKKVENVVHPTPK